MEATDQYYIKMAGHLYGSHAKLFALIDNSPNHQVIQMFKTESDDNKRVTSCTAVDVFGTEKYLAIKTSGDDNLTRFVVKTASQDIGLFRIFQSTIDKNLKKNQRSWHEIVEVFDESEKKMFEGRLKQDGKRISFYINRVNGKIVCSAVNNFKNIVSVRLAKNLNDNEKVMISAVNIFVIQWRFQLRKYLPSIDISISKNDIDMTMRKPTTRERTSFNSLLAMGGVIINIAGHDSLKNIIYYDVYNQNTPDVYATIEVTPVNDYQGYAQMVIKDSIGSTLCTAIHFAYHDLTALYDNNNSLFAYRQQMNICDTNHQPILKLINLRASGKKAGGAALRYINPNDSYTHAEEVLLISAARRIVNRQFERVYTFHQLVEILILSMHQELLSVSPEKPIPEIEYFYLNSKPASRSYMT